MEGSAICVTFGLDVASSSDEAGDRIESSASNGGPTRADGCHTARAVAVCLQCQPACTMYCPIQIPGWAPSAPSADDGHA